MKNKILFFLLLFLLANPIFAQERIKIESLKEIISTEMKGMEGQVFNPQICPNDSDLISFQHRIKDKVELYIFDCLSSKLERVTARSEVETKDEYEEDFSGLLFKGVDYQLDWRPILDKNKKQWYVFTGDGGVENLDLYLGQVGEKRKIKLTNDGNRNFVDGYPKWSPDGKHIVFVSQRTGKGDIYLLADVDKIIDEQEQPGQPTRLTINDELDFYPVWNPDPSSGYIAYTAVNHDPVAGTYFSINVIDIFLGAVSIPVTENQQFDYSRPNWDKRTGSYLTYFVSRSPVEIDMKGTTIKQDQKAEIGIHKLELDEKKNLKKPTEIRGDNLHIAYDVVSDDDSGPLWVSGSLYIMYVKSKIEQYNPIYVAHRGYWEDDLGKYTFRVHQDYKMPQDLFIQKNKIAFACQDGKEYKIIKGTLSGEDFELLRFTDYALGRPKLAKSFIEGKTKIGELPQLNDQNLFEWLMKPVVGNNPLLVFNRRITLATAIIGTGIYFIIKDGKDVKQPPNPWIPPEWPETKKFHFKINF